jgi:hypothetical protein
MKPEAIICVRFLTTEEGGRSTSIDNSRYGCPVIVNELYFDCRFIMNDRVSFELGKTYEIPVKFLNPKLALNEIKEGIEISLWEGKIIAIGKVFKVF